MVSDYTAELLELVVQRNRYETQTFADLIESHNTFSKSNAVLLEQKTELERANILLRHQSEEALKSSDGSGVVKKLEAKIHELQTELTEKFRSASAGANSQLQLTEQVRLLQAALQKTQTEVVTLQQNLSTEQEKARAAEALALERTGDGELLRAELNRVRVLLATAEKERDEANTSNHQLVQRLLSEKTKNASEMNHMNALLERLQGRGNERRSAEAAAEGVSFDGAESVEFRSATAPPSVCRHAIRAHTTEINCVAFDESGGTVATGSSDSSVKLWEASTAKLRGTLAAGGSAVMSVCISGELAAGGCSDRNARVWNLATSRIKHTLTGHTGKIYCTKFSPNGRQLVTGASDRSVKVWDLQSGFVSRSASAGSSVHSLDVAPDGTTVGTGHQDGAMRLWDLRSARRLHELRDVHPAAITSIAFSRADGGAAVLTACRDNRLRLLDTRTFNVVRTFAHDQFRVGYNWSHACYSPSGRFVSCGGGDGAVYVWDALTSGLEEEPVSILTGHSGAVAGSDWSGSGQQLATGDSNGFLMLWE